MIYSHLRCLPVDQSSLSLLIIVLFICGCVPTIHDYKYLSFEEADGARVIAWMDDKPKGVILDNKVPLEYELRRPFYIIKIRLTDEKNGQLAYLTARDSGGENYSIKGQFIIDLIANAKYPGYRYYFFPPHRLPTSDLQFTLFNKEGAEVATETIPFNVKVGGTVLEFDGL